jgi:D-alanyl-D-alanine carboxypeptidase/D-alanyl-D-alanine-endopeptidase (penicillin-binding protein 4)
VVVNELRAAGVPVGGVRIVDGSGLSRLDRLTAQALVGILRAGADDPAIAGHFVTSLAVAGVSGTLKRRLERRPTRGRVIAKTGTTSISSALAGFVRKRYVFAIVQNGSPVPYWTARQAQDRFVTILARR